MSTDGEAGAGVALETDGLGVAYGRTRVLAGISLAVPRGSVFALLGRNGSGKTSLLRCLLGQRPAAAGRVQVLGEDPWRHRRPLMERVGVVPEEPNAFPEMTARPLIFDLAQDRVVETLTGMRPDPQFPRLEPPSLKAGSATPTVHFFSRRGQLVRVDFATGEHRVVAGPGTPEGERLATWNP